MQYITKYQLRKFSLYGAYSLLSASFFLGLINLDIHIFRYTLLFVFIFAIGSCIGIKFRRIWENYYPLLLIYFVIILNLLSNKSFGQIDLAFILSILFIIVIQNEDIIGIIKVSFWTKLICFLVTLILFLTKLIPDSVLNDRIIRHSFGFDHPNGLGFIFLVLSMEFIYIYWKKVSLVHLILLFIINTVVFIISGSRTAFLCFIILFIALNAVKYWSKIFHTKIIRIIMIAVLPLLFTLPILLPYIYSENNEILKELDRIFSNRLRMGHYYLMKNGFSLFGHAIDENINVKLGDWETNYVLDSSYLRICLQFGIIVYSIVSVFVIYKCILLINKKLYLEYWLVICCLIYGIYERLAYNIFLFSIILLVFSVHSNKKKGCLLTRKKSSKMMSIFNK